MDSATPRLLALYNRYLTNNATESELSEFFDLLHEPGNENLLEEIVGMTWDEAEEEQRSGNTATAVAKPL